MDIFTHPVILNPKVAASREELTQEIYKTTDYYAPEYEPSIVWNNPAIDVKWPINGETILSTKDQQAKTLAIAEHFRMTYFA